MRDTLDRLFQEQRTRVRQQLMPRRRPRKTDESMTLEIRTAQGTRLLQDVSTRIPDRNPLSW